MSGSFSMTSVFSSVFISFYKTGCENKIGFFLASREYPLKIKKMLEC